MVVRQTGMRRHRSVCFTFKDGICFSRLDFSRKLFQGSLTFTPNDVNSFLTLPFNKGFDVSFWAATTFNDLWARFELVKTQFSAFDLERLNDSAFVGSTCWFSAYNYQQS